MINTATNRISDNLSTALLDQDDLQLVRDGAPAYLLMMDGMVQGDPDNTDLLLTAARLYSTYASAFVDDEDRASRLARKGTDYARRGLCLDLPAVCQATGKPYSGFTPTLDTLTSNDVPTLYGFTSAWALQLKADGDNWHSVAEIPKIEASMQRVVELDEGFDHGGAHLVLGVLATRLPPGLGGNPDIARQHFERVIEMNQQRHLLASVLYAKHYARMMFDRDLHDSLLREVLNADPTASGLTLMNTLAQQQARELLESSDAYF